MDCDAILEQYLNFEIAKQQKELRANQDAFEESLSTVKKQEMQKVVEQLSGVVTKIAKKMEFDLVLFKDVTLYNDSKFDITDEVSKVAATL